MYARWLHLGNVWHIKLQLECEWRNGFIHVFSLRELTSIVISQIIMRYLFVYHNQQRINAVSDDLVFSMCFSFFIQVCDSTWFILLTVRHLQWTSWTVMFITLLLWWCVNYSLLYCWCDLWTIVKCVLISHFVFYFAVGPVNGFQISNWLPKLMFRIICKRLKDDKWVITWILLTFRISWEQIFQRRKERNFTEERKREREKEEERLFHFILAINFFQTSSVILWRAFKWHKISDL